MASAVLADLYLLDYMLDLEEHLVPLASSQFLRIAPEPNVASFLVVEDVPSTHQ